MTSFAVPGKMTVKIGDAENRWPVCLDIVLPPVTFKSGVLNKVYKMLKHVLFLLLKENLRILLSFLHYRLPRFSGKGQNHVTATQSSDVINRSIKLQTYLTTDSDA